MGLGQKFLDAVLNPLAKRIRDAEQRKGNFQWMSGLPSKKVLKPVVINAQTLKQLSNTDPITWAIKTTRKQQVTQTKWDIVPDTEEIEAELDRWYSILINNLNPWGFQEVFHPSIINKDLFLKASTDIKAILNIAEVARKDKKDQLKWYFESIKRKVKQDASDHARIVRRIFEKPNDSECRTFRSLLEILVDDILTFDAGVLVKNRNMMGELAELYPIPGQDVKLYRNPDRTLPQPPENAYVWEDNGVLRAEYTRDEIVYIMANPQHTGYGQSPLEVAAYIITASLFADEYNIDFFKHSNVPPSIINLGKNITEEQRRQFQIGWDNEVMGKGLNRMMFIAGADTPQYIEMRGMSSRDMQMMEYLKWTLSIKCACFQISPQDISFVQDFHRSTAQVQKELSKTRGIKNMLSLLETYFNTEIVKKEFPFKDVQFQWQSIDLQDDQTQSTIDINDINAGVISRNDRRKRIGLPPVEGGDTILVAVGQSLIPIEQLVPKEEEQTAQQPVEAKLKQTNPAGLKQERSDATQQTVSGVDQSATDEKGGPPKTGAPDGKVAISDENKKRFVHMIVNYASQDKIQKAMDALKEQGLGDNEVKIKLET